MNLSEEQIKNILQHTQVDIEPELHLEDNIINEINNLKHYDQLVQKNKRKAKISLWVSLNTTAYLIISLLYSLISITPQQLGTHQTMLPTFMVITALFMLHQLLYFNQNLQKRAKA